MNGETRPSATGRVGALAKRILIIAGRLVTLFVAILVLLEILHVAGVG